MARDSFTHTLLRLALRWLTVLALGGLCGLCGLWGLPGAAMAQGANPKFDHVKTGFPLSGAHTSTRCESCHINGVFKGTPRDCQTCHTTGSRFSRANATMPGKHIPVSVQQTCDSCHGTQAFTGVRFSHSTMVSGARCQTCHDGVRSQGKPATHIPTRAACETCHTTNTWNSARPDHSGFNASTNCASCHNGSAASGKSGNHIPTSGSCSSCHSTSTWKPSTWNHSQQSVAGQCASCHTGTYAGADGKPQNHIPYAALSGVAIANCDTCHKGGFSSWNPGRFHASVSIVGQCATCHLTPAYGLTAKPNTAIHTSVTGGCESCHKTSGWASSARVDHSTFNTATQCASCHNGSAATGKPTSHIPVSGNCTSCHSTAAWRPSSWNHTQQVVANQCSTCHSGAYPPADGKPQNHIPYTALSGVAIANCDTCHKGGFSSWNPGRFHASVSIVGQCATCHLTPVYGLTAKPSTTVHAGVSSGCEACHNTSGWAGARVDHSKFNTTTQCASCHNGSAATGKPGNHIPVTANCISCHSTQTWKPSSWNHTQVVVANQCSSCHSGAYPPADGRPGNHIPYTALSGVAIANCDSCHKGGFSRWNPGRFHASVSIVGQCATCHLTPVYGLTSKPANALHASVTGGCEACHNTSGWSGARVDHSKFNTTTQCASCHNGSTATGKPGNHIPTAANCISCHTTSTFSTGKFHGNVPFTTACATCHNGAYVGPDNKPSNHIPYQSVSATATAGCDTCHKGGFTTWANGRLHTNVTVTTQCKTCHIGNYLGSIGKPNNHIPESQLLNGTLMECNACHKSTAAGGFGTAVMDHNNSQGNGSGWCYACHRSGTAFLGNMDRKSLTHQKSSGVTDCSQSGCHRPLGTRGTTYRSWD